MNTYKDQFIHYVILLSMNPDQKLTEPLIREHVKFLKKLDEKRKLVLCGPFKDYHGGMIIIRANSLEEAKTIAEQDPFVLNGVESYELRTWEISCEENNHLGMG